jgi:hypothetical protein
MPAKSPSARTSAGGRAPTMNNWLRGTRARTDGHTSFANHRTASAFGGQ